MLSVPFKPLRRQFLCPSDHLSELITEQEGFAAPTWSISQSDYGVCIGDYINSTGVGASPSFGNIGFGPNNTPNPVREVLPAASSSFCCERSNMQPSRFLCLAGLCLIALVGCGPDDRAPLGAVSGTVSYQGQPLSAGTIIFEVPGARPAYGKIVDGSITAVSTYEPEDGVPVGEARIAIFASEVAGASAVTAGDPGTVIRPGADYMGGNARPLIPSRYGNPATSGLTHQITSGSNSITLSLTD